MARQEAESCINAISGYEVQYPVCFDFEYASVDYAENQGVNVTKELATSLVDAFCQRVEVLGYFAMYYSNLDFLNRMFRRFLKKQVCALVRAVCCRASCQRNGYLAV